MELENSNQEASLSKSKKHLCGPWVSFVTTDQFSVRITKIIMGVSRTNSLRFWFLAVFELMKALLSKVHKPDNFEPYNSLNICGLCFNCFNFLELISPGILGQYERNLVDSISSSSFSARVYLPLIWKDFVTHMHGLAVYVKEGLPFARDLSLENSADSNCFRLVLLH